MFDNMFKIYNAFLEQGVEESLFETFRIFDILSKRDLSKVDLSLLDYKKLDIAQLVTKRKEGVPFEYIIGMSPFLGRMFYCSSETLIPREETELLANIALNYIQTKQSHEEKLNIIDMGTGCGNIAVSLALNSNGTTILASDLSKETVDIACKNVEKYGLRDRVSLFNGDLFSPIEGSGFESNIDIIVCNPPYIPTNSLQNLSSEIIDHEPKEAFDAGPFGIDFYRRLIKDSTVFLKPGGILVFEIGVGQEKIVTRLFKKKSEYSNIEYFDDGKQIRVISAIHTPIE